MRSLARRWALALGTMIAALLAVAAAAAAATPIPKVTGPIAVTASSHPFGGAQWQLQPQDLADHGYVEEEYLVSGRANVYDWNADKKAVVRTPRAPYTTRMIVRRPIKRTRMSGTVVVEPLNPSNLFDLNIGWALSATSSCATATVGRLHVQARRRPVAEDVRPARYGKLDWDNPLPLDDPRNCAQADIQTIVDPPEERRRESEDGLVWDMISQVAAWARSTAKSNPLARRAAPAQHVVDRVYGFGYSQTGSMLITYINAIRPRQIAADGHALYDGYFVGVAGGRFIGAAPLNQCTPVPPLGTRAAPSATPASP